MCFLFEWHIRSKKRTKTIKDMGKTAFWLGWIISNILLAHISLAKNVLVPQEYAVLRNMNQDWLVYDGSYGGYVPYMKDRHIHLTSVSFWLDSKQQAPYQLLLYAESNTYLYIQKRLAYRFDREGWHIFSVDSLQKIYGESNLFCTWYDANKRLPLPTVAIVTNNKNTQAKNALASIKTANLDRTLRADDHKDWGILAGIIVLICYTGLFNYNPKTFTSFFSGRSSLSTLSRKDPALVQKPFNGINLAYMSALALLLSYFYMMWSISQGNKLQLFWVNAELSTVALVFNQLGYWVLAFGLLVGKLFALLFLGRILNVERQIVYVHYFEYMRFTQIFYMGIGIVGAVVFCCYGEYNTTFFEIALYFIPLFHLFQAFAMSFFVIKQVEFLNLYIFYYLCTTELTPWLIGVKMLLFS